MPPVHSALYYYIAIFKKKTKQCQKTQPPHIWFGKLWLHQFQITLQLFSQGRHLSAFLESSEFWNSGFWNQVHLINTFPKRMKQNKLLLCLTLKTAGIQNYIPLSCISFPVWNSNTLREHLRCATLTKQQKHSMASLTCFSVMPLCASRSLLLIKSSQISTNSMTAVSSACNLLRLSESLSNYFCKFSISFCSPSLCKMCTTSYSMHFLCSEAILTF